LSEVIVVVVLALLTVCEAVPELMLKLESPW